MKPIYVVVNLAILIAGCSGGPSVDIVATSVAATMAAQQPAQQAQAPAVEVQPTETTAPIATKPPTATTAPTSTPRPTTTPTLAPTYAQPVVLRYFSGTYGTITDDYWLPQCWKSVLYWHVDASSYGTASLIMHGYNKGTGGEMSLVNTMATDVGSLDGTVLIPLKGGTYYFQTENTDESWTAKIECQDGVAPAGTGMDVQAVGYAVTENYTLSKCTKSVFNWSVEPSSYGTASLILHLCKANETNSCESLVNEMKTDMSSPMTGQALQKVENGDYFLVSDNTNEPWTVTWECKD